jgi:hypothetical protein
MDKVDEKVLKDYLKNNLRIKINANDRGKTIKVTLYLGNEVLSEDAMYTGNIASSDCEKFVLKNFQDHL